MATVNRPTNVKQKEEDVNQKLQLYGIYSGKYQFSHIVHQRHRRSPAWLIFKLRAQLVISG